MLVYLIEREAKMEYERAEAKADNDFRGRVFAADLPYLKAYNAMFPAEGTLEDEYGVIEEIVPQNERELQKLMNEMRRSGVKFAD